MKTNQLTCLLSGIFLLTALNISAQESLRTAAGLPDITDNAGGIISDQYNVTGGEGIAKLIDNSIYTKYLTYNPTTWVQFKATAGAVVTQYAITSGNDATGRDPLNWTFQGSNNGTTWTTLDTRTGEKFINRQSTKTYTFTNSASFSYYRLNVTANNGDGYFQLAEWQIFGTGGGNPNTSLPAAPTALTGTVESGNQVILNWTDNASNESAFRVEWSSDGGNSWSTKAVDGNTTKYISFGLKELTSYRFRVRAENANGNSVYTNVVTAQTISGAFPTTWKEHWLEHDQLVSLVYSNADLGLYFDPDMDKNLTWMRKVFTDAWVYTKNTYGDFSDPKLYVILHQNKYSGGNPSTYFDATRDYRNAICVGQNGSWASNTGWNLDASIHEIGHIVEGGCKGVHNSPSFPLWGDSKWMEIYQYDLYKKLGWTSEATRWYNNCINGTDSYPVAGSHWFKNWFYPIYSQYGETKVLNNYFTLLSQYFPKYNGEYSRDLNYGEFVHFWSGAACHDLKAQATLAFGWPADWEVQYQQAKIDFPFTYNCTTTGVEDEQPALTEEKVLVWPNPASGQVYVSIVGLGKSHEVSIYASDGSLAAKSHLDGTLGSINISGLSGDLYYVKITSENGKVYNQKLLIEK